MRALARATDGRTHRYDHAEHCVVLNIHGEIGTTCRASHVEAALTRYPRVDRVELNIDSNGGSVHEAKRIAELIQSHQAVQKTATIDGTCASAAVRILLAADFRVAVRRNARVMIHQPEIRPERGERATAATYRQRARILDEVTRSLIAIYSERTGKPRSAFEKEICTENDMSLKKALDLGLINAFDDEVLWLRGQPFIFPQMGRRP